MKALTFFWRLFYDCIINCKLLFRVFMAVYIALLALSCKSVEKTQFAKSETTTVKKSDSSSTKSFTVIDTTRTDSSTEITETTLTVDSFEYVSHGDLRTNDLTNFGVVTTNDLMTTGSYLTVLTGAVKAKGVTIHTKTIKRAVVVAKGQTTQAVNVQTDIKSDSATVKTDEGKSTVKQPKPFKTALTIIFVVVGLSGAVMIYVWYRKKRKAITGLS